VLNFCESDPDLFFYPFDGRSSETSIGDLGRAVGRDGNASDGHVDRTERRPMGGAGEPEAEPEPAQEDKGTIYERRDAEEDI
jgi:hypothetical protein